MTNRTSHKNIVHTSMFITDEEYDILYEPPYDNALYGVEGIANDGEKFFGTEMMWLSVDTFDGRWSWILNLMADNQDHANATCERVENFLKQEKDKQNARQ